MVINAAGNRQKNVLMTITSLSGHAQLMVLVFLPRESVRDILAILHQQRQPRSQSFSPAKSGNPGDKDLSKGDLKVLSRVFQNSILLRLFFFVVYMSVLKSVVLSSLRMKLKLYAIIL